MNKQICLITIVDSVSPTSMPVNEFVIYRSKHGYPYSQVLISCLDAYPNNVNIPDNINTHFIKKGKTELRKVLKRIIYENKDKQCIFHLHSQKSAIKFFLSSIGLGVRRRTLFTIHSSYKSRDLKYKFSSCLCSILSNYTNCVSYAAYKEYSPFVKWLKGSRMITIQNGVDFDRVQDAIRGLPKHSDVANMQKIVSVGRMIPIKNQSFLIKLLKYLPETELVLIGQEDKNVIEFAKELGVEKRVHVTGLIARDEVFRKLNECGIYVSASLVEGMPISVLEAMAVGLIPVISDIAPHKEVSNSCKLFNTMPLVESDWVQSIIAYQQLNRNEIVKFSSQIKNSVLNEFSLDAMHEKYIKIYEHLAQ